MAYPDLIHSNQQLARDPWKMKELRVTDHKCSCIKTDCKCCVKAKLKMFLNVKGKVQYYETIVRQERKHAGSKN